MTSVAHTVLIELLRRDPSLAASLLRRTGGAPLPSFAAVQLADAAFAEVDPTELRADLVITLLDRTGKLRLAIVVEAQLRRDPDKRYSWPVYLASLRRRLRCPVRLLVVTTRRAVARWCARPIDMGDGQWVLTPDVLGPDQIPVITEARVACRRPELAMLSVIAHGLGERGVEVGRAALRAVRSLDSERRPLYTDLVVAFLSTAARAALGAVMQLTAEDEILLKSDFAQRLRKLFFGRDMADRRRAIREGTAEGEARGEARGLRTGTARGKAEGLRAGELVGLREALLAVLTGRGLRLTTAQRRRIDATADRDLLTAWIQRATVARSTREVFTRRGGTD